MDAPTVFRIISLIPDRVARAQSGCLFSAGGREERVALLERLLHWLAPLDSLSVENQQLLGLRSGGGRAAAALDEEIEPGDDEAEEDLGLEEIESEPESTSMTQPGAGTQIAV